MSTLSDDYLFVVAIDFGTTYSGYAFSSRNDFKTDPLKIISNQAWNAGSQRHCSLKTPTCLLLDDKEDFVSFGYEAENLYSEKVMDGQQNEYFFFQRFKMQLYKDEHVKVDMLIEDVTGKPVSAMKVFAESIKALMKHLFDTFKEQGVEIVKEDIRWVLTVPAIWTDAAKQFMRKSAIMADILDNQLVIALEPEAASIYCQYLPTKKLKDAEDLMMSKVGTQYMVVDNGGGTCDITVHEKLQNGTLKELCRASGADCGGTSVDMGFFQLFVKLVGAPLMTLMKKEEPSAYLDIFREIEAVKRTVGLDKNDRVMFSFPRVVLDEMCKKHIGEDFTTIIDQSCYKDQIIIRYDKMRIDSGLVKPLFKDTATKIVEQMNRVIKTTNDFNVGLIVLVGGFSQCKIIQNEIRLSFPDSKVIVPGDAVLAVLKGAVLFGHRPDYIISRIARYTYGISFEPIFDPQQHDLKRKIFVDNTERCANVFCTYVKRGDEIKIGTEIEKDFISRDFVDTTLFSVHRSTSTNPQYTDEDDCHLIGNIIICFPKAPEGGRKLLCQMIFGNTEVAVAAFDVLSGEKCETTFELI